jgi:hypothetical protein
MKLLRHGHLHDAATYRDFPHTRSQELPTDKRRPSRYTLVSVWSGSVSLRRIPLREITQGDAVMALLVSDETIRNATCPHDFDCLYSEAYPLCPGQRLIPRSGLFVQAAFTLSCPCRVHFGNSDFCTCPVRAELYIRHGV